MKKNKKFYSFNDFVIANTTRPWFIFNDISTDFINLNHNDLIENINDLIEEKNDNLIEESPLDLLNFNIDDIELIFDNYINKELSEENQQKIQKISTYDKLEFLEKELSKNTKLQEKFNKEDLYKNINYLFKMFNNYELLNTGLDLVSKQGIDYLIQTYKNNYKFKEEEIIFISDKQTIETKIKETQEAFKKSYKLIINPCLEYKGCISKPIFIDIQNGIFGNLNYSSKTKRKNLLKAYFDYKIISQYLEIKSIKILRPLYQNNKNVRKGILKFELSEYSSFSKGGVDSNSLKNIQAESEINAKLVSDPNFNYSNTKTKKNNVTIIEHVLNDLTSAQYDFNEKRVLIEKTKLSKYTCSFDEFLYLIKNQDNIDINWKLTKDDFINNFDNVGFNILINKNYPQYPFGAKKFFKLISNELIKEPGDDLKTQKAIEFFTNNLISINESIIQTEEYKVISDTKSKIAWFDFEGVSLPVPLVDYLRPWNQTISQTSIIKTQNNEIYETSNYVYDPLELGLNTYKKIIDDLYDNEIDYYIVYNQNYEKPRLEEIKFRLGIYLDNNKITKNEFENYANKIDFIVKRIVDLEKLFYSSKNFGWPMVSDRIINIGYIRDSYSIKKLEYFVTQNHIYKYLKHKITPYSELEVKNGASALSIATTRALNVIKDNEWAKKVEALKIYCHNDVMAMLMVADLVKFLMKNSKEYFDNFKKYNI
ncbi:DUF2779 domain-containing protein [Metamycoplasma phocicerebrale]|uniref:DUF2779 domain-containing protein n=1 Tax=Metamycoplasma phocicerebrale TaxID=142649 RepID=A0A3T0TTU1_9BACT|nr:DUF2779 domain-containing protein [Metamycoplasma phocicerebrale]AZZ65480.1 DUF2779 domain-containing protein [Metamycoplasma phocicerebrale]